MNPFAAAGGSPKCRENIYKTIFMPTVIVLGGEVAGMSAAHELVNRGYFSLPFNINGIFQKVDS
jgi:hypothetical protein